MPRPASNGAEPPTIKQAELRDYRKLCEERRRIDLACNTLRESLLKRLQAKAEIQDGKLTAFVVSASQIRFSYEAIAAARGEKFATKLRAELPETVSTTVKVEEAG